MLSICCTSIFIQSNPQIANYLFAAHNGSNYLNGLCFVNLMLCVPVWKGNRIVYQSVPLGYRMWTKEISKLQLAAGMVRAVMPELEQKHQVLLPFDSWYAKSVVLSLANEYENLDIICNASYDSAIFDLPPAPTGKRGRPAKYGKRLSILEDFSLSAEKKLRLTKPAGNGCNTCLCLCTLSDGKLK